MPDRPDDFVPNFDTPERPPSDAEELWLAWLPPDFNKPPVKDFPPSEFTENGVEIRRYFNRPGMDNAPAPIYSPGQTFSPPSDATRPHEITQAMGTSPAPLQVEETSAVVLPDESVLPESSPESSKSADFQENDARSDADNEELLESSTPPYDSHLDIHPSDPISTPPAFDALPLQSMLDVSTDDLPVIRMASAEPDTAPATTPDNRKQGIPLLAVLISLVIGLLLIAANFMMWEYLTGVRIGFEPTFGDVFTMVQPTQIPTLVSPVESVEPTLTPTIVGLLTPLAQNGAAPPPTLDAPTATPDLHFVAGKLIQGDVTMINIEGGTFPMGSDTGEVESPIHSVTVSAYYIDQVEVTIANWQECVEAGACTLPGTLSNYDVTTYGNYPVTAISWHNASAYCSWRGARLPTEAEWEMAARWDPDSGQVMEYPWGDEWDHLRLNYCDSSCTAGQPDANFNDGWPQTAPVASFPSGISPSGVFDMAGNVAEWVADWFSPAYYNISPGWNPQGPLEGTFKGVRGGAWNLSSFDSRSAARMSADPFTQSAGIGFRCALSASDINQP